MNTLAWWLRLTVLAVAGGAVALLVQHWTDGRPWPEAGVPAALLVVVALLMGVVSRRSRRDLW